MTVSSDRMQRMLVEIARNVDVTASELQPLAEEELTVWRSLQVEVANIRAQGRQLLIPNEMPNLASYVKGRAPGIGGIP